MSGQTMKRAAGRVVRAPMVPRGLFEPRPAGEQIYPEDLPIFQNGVACGRVFVTSNEEFWVTYTDTDSGGAYTKYQSIKSGNQLTFGAGNTPELKFAHDVVYNRGSDPTSFAAYRAKLPAHDCISWAVTLPSGLPTGAPGNVYKIMQGNGSNNVWVGYAVFDTLEHHWVLFTQTGGSGEKKFTYIGQSTLANNGNLQFTATTLPSSLSVTYDHIKCVGTVVP